MKKFLLMVVLIGVVFVQTTISAEDKKYSGSEKDLIGYWCSKSIKGDALFFVVSAIEARMDNSGNYSGDVVFTDFQTIGQKGTYKVVEDNIFISKKGLKVPYKLRCWFENPEKTILKVEDEQFGVTLSLNKGKKKTSDSLF